MKDIDKVKEVFTCPYSIYSDRKRVVVYLDELLKIIELTNNTQTMKS